VLLGALGVGVDPDVGDLAACELVEKLVDLPVLAVECGHVEVDVPAEGAKVELGHGLTPFFGRVARAVRVSVAVRSPKMRARSHRQDRGGRSSTSMPNRSWRST